MNTNFKKHRIVHIDRLGREIIVSTTPEEALELTSLAEVKSLMSGRYLLVVKYNVSMEDVIDAVQNAFDRLNAKSSSIFDDDKVTLVNVNFLTREMVVKALESDKEDLERYGKVYKWFGLESRFAIKISNDRNIQDVVEEFLSDYDLLEDHEIKKAPEVPKKKSDAAVTNVFKRSQISWFHNGPEAAEYSQIYYEGLRSGKSREELKKANDFLHETTEKLAKEAALREEKELRDQMSVDMWPPIYTWPPIYMHRKDEFKTRKSGKSGFYTEALLQQIRDLPGTLDKKRKIIVLDVEGSGVQPEELNRICDTWALIQCPHIGAFDVAQNYIREMLKKWRWEK